MNITVTGRQFEITPSIREYVEKHIETLLEDKALNVTSVNVVCASRYKSQLTPRIIPIIKIPAATNGSVSTVSRILNSI